MRRLAGVAIFASALILPSTALASQTLTVEKEGTGSGKVTSSPAGISCDPTCSFAFADGAVVLLTGTPGANTAAVAWSGCDSITVEKKCKVTMSAAKTVTATFNVLKRKLSVTKAGTGTGTVKSAPAGIECPSICSAEYDHGTEVTLTGISGTNTEAVKWSGCDSVNAEGKCIVTMNAAREVSALFDVEGPTLTVTKLGNGTGTVTSSPAAIECPSACAVNFPKGQAVTLTGVPGLHSEAVKWAGCDTVTAENKCLVSMGSSREVSAIFALEPQYVQYTVSVAKKGTGQGTVTSLPGGIECGADCSSDYVFRTQLTLLATPAPGSVLDHWSIASCSDSLSCTLAVKARRTVNAVFVAVGNRTLTVAKAGTGSGTVTSKPAGIECGSVCSTELDASTKVVLKAEPAPGSTFAGWSGEGCSGTGNCHVQMNEARSVTATFTSSSAPARCVVPRLAGKTLAKARSALIAARCSLGKVRKPKGAKLSRLRVRSSSPGAGSVLGGGARVDVKLARKR